MPVVGGHDQPLFACYDRERVLALGSDLGGRGPHGLLDRLDRVEATEADTGLARAVTNVNTREELEELRDEVVGES